MVGAEFEDRTWRAFWRTVVEGESPANVAGELGMTAHAVYKAKSRVLGRVRVQLRELESDQ
jgi:RNA polymerase sigma-70 factor (ECF subfamily)